LVCVVGVLVAVSILVPVLLVGVLMLEQVTHISATCQTGSQLVDGTYQLVVVELPAARPETKNIKAVRSGIIFSLSR